MSLAAAACTTSTAPGTPIPAPGPEAGGGCAVSPPEEAEVFSVIRSAGSLVPKVTEPGTFSGKTAHQLGKRCGDVSLLFLRSATCLGSVDNRVDPGPDFGRERVGGCG